MIEGIALKFLRTLGGDILLFRGDGILARLILWAQRRRGETRSRCNHVGMALNAASLYLAVMIEALWKVRAGRIWSFYHGNSSKVTIYRCRGLTDQQRQLLVEEALKYKGRHYGVLKIPVHLLGRWFGRGLVKKLLFIDGLPICSWVIEKPWLRLRQALGPIPSSLVGEGFYGQDGELVFGVPVDTVEPDDIDDWCRAHPEQWEEVLPLQRI